MRLLCRSHTGQAVIGVDGEVAGGAKDNGEEDGGGAKDDGEEDGGGAEEDGGGTEQHSDHLACAAGEHPLCSRDVDTDGGKDCKSIAVPAAAGQDATRGQISARRRIGQTGGA